jgi:hypothetical protein
MSRYLNNEAYEAAVKSGLEAELGHTNNQSIGMTYEQHMKNQGIDITIPKNKSEQIGQIAGAIGSIAGIAYAFKVKSGFWKGWGFAIIGSVALGGLGYAIGSTIKNKDHYDPHNSVRF